MGSHGASSATPPSRVGNWWDDDDFVPVGPQIEFFLGKDSDYGGEGSYAAVRTGCEVSLGGYRKLPPHCRTQRNDTLVDLLLEQARDDDFLRGRLFLEAAKKSGASVDLDQFRTAIESVINVGDFVDYRSMYAYSSGIQDVIDSVERLLKEGHAAEVIELCEHALTCLEDALGRVDDSDGYMGGIKEQVCELHHRACVASRPDPEALAKRLFEWELHSAALRVGDLLRCGRDVRRRARR